MNNKLLFVVNLFGCNVCICICYSLALKQHKEIRKCCNAFFLEVVSRFCLTDDQDPPEDLVELLFSLLISAQGGWICLWNISLQNVFSVYRWLLFSKQLL